MKRLLALVLLVTLAAPNVRPADGDPPVEATPAQLPPLMQMKLERSKHILEGLAMENFQMIAKNARSLELLSMESGWNVMQTEEYATQSRDFRRTCKLIAEAASEKDISRAALGYVAMTVRCVECHAYMRKHRSDSIRPNADRTPAMACYWTSRNIL